MRRKVIILGATGSVGTTALNALASFEREFEVVALSAYSNAKKLVDLANKFNCKNIALNKNYSEISFDGTLYKKREGLVKMIEDVEADIVLNAISGSNGIVPSYVTLSSGKNLAISNKESMVAPGRILIKLAESKGVKIIPVDSEHSTLWALLNAFKDRVDTLVLTGSGGPFKDLDASKFKDVTVEQALKHPTWSMGPKISIDSATYANKGLEVIEAVNLFDYSPEKVEVVIHPQSIVHSLVRLTDGSLFAQLSPPDMTLPVMNALKEKSVVLENLVKKLDFTNLNLNFSKPDYEKFPLLKLAFQCAKEGQASSIVYNGANEVAVEAFVQNMIKFNDIPTVVSKALDKQYPTTINSIDEVLEINRLSHSIGWSIVKELS
ncbi:MAG: 1-deoxy-D-xylulose-5-phosphate reductoisomerase [Sphaerochaetaceae bacterium]|jgi:1-deoxy-D-xylulose-5-phosphate reductoisomerase